MNQFIETVKAICPQILAESIIDGYAEIASPEIEAVHDYRNDPGAREIAHGIKDGDPEAIRSAAKDMAAHVSAQDTLVPIPNHLGYADTTLSLCNAIAEISGCHVLDILHGKTRPRLYDLKRSRDNLARYDFGYTPDSYVRPGEIYLVDNVYATGRTAANACRAIPGAKVLVYARDYSADAYTESRSAGYQNTLTEGVSDIKSFNHILNMVNRIRRVIKTLLIDGKLLKDLSLTRRFDYIVPATKTMPAISLEAPDNHALAAYTPPNNTVHIPVSTILAAGGFATCDDSIAYFIGRTMRRKHYSTVAKIYNAAFEKAWPLDWADGNHNCILPNTLLHEFRHMFDFKHTPGMLMYKNIPGLNYDDIYNRMSDAGKFYYNEIRDRDRNFYLHMHSPETRRALNRQHPKITRDEVEKIGTITKHPPEYYPEETLRALDQSSHDSYWLDSAEINARLTEHIPEIIRSLKKYNMMGTPYTQAKARFMVSISAGLAKMVLGITKYTRTHYPEEYNRKKALIPRKLFKRLIKRAYFLCYNLSSASLSPDSSAKSIASETLNTLQHRH